MVWGKIAAMAAEKFAPQLAGRAAEWGAERTVANYAGRKAASWVASEAGQAMVGKAVGTTVATKLATPTGQKLARRYVSGQVKKVIPGGAKEGKADTPRTMFVQTPTQTNYARGGNPRSGTFAEGYYYGQQRSSGGGGSGGTSNWWSAHQAFAGQKTNYDWRSIEFRPVAKGGSLGGKPLLAEGRGKDFLRGYMSQRNATEEPSLSERIGFNNPTTGKPVVSATGNPTGVSAYPRPRSQEFFNQTPWSRNPASADVSFT